MSIEFLTSASTNFNFWELFGCFFSLFLSTGSCPVLLIQYLLTSAFWKPSRGARLKPQYSLCRFSLISLLLASPAPSFHWASVPKSGVTWIQFLQKVDNPPVFGGHRRGQWEPPCCVGKAEGSYCFEFRFSTKSLCLALWLTLCNWGAWALQALNFAGILGVMVWVLKCGFCGHRGTASSSLLDQFLKRCLFSVQEHVAVSPVQLPLLFCWWLWGTALPSHTFSTKSTPPAGAWLGVPWARWPSHQPSPIQFVLLCIYGAPPGQCWC